MTLSYLCFLSCTVYYEESANVITHVTLSRASMIDNHTLIELLIISNQHKKWLASLPLNLWQSHLKVWLKLNKFYITIAQVTEHKKTNKIVFVWRKSVKDIKNWSLSNIAFLILSFKHRFKHGSGFWPWSSWYLGTKSCINAHCPSAKVLFVQASLCNCPVYWEW